MEHHAPPHRLGLAVALALVASSLGCATENPGIDPPRAGFYFPTGVAVDPRAPYLYVSNTNADLMYNGGTVAVLDLKNLPVDLSQVGALVKAGTLSCAPDRLEQTRWECGAEGFIVPDATLRIGDFPGDIEVLADGSRIFVPVRGQDYLAHAKVIRSADGSRILDLACSREGEGAAGTAGDASWDCDAEHRVAYSEDIRTRLPAEPFGIHVNELTDVYVDAAGRRRTCRDGVSSVPCTCPTKKDPNTGVVDCAPPCSETVTAACWQRRPSAAAHVYVSHLFGGEVSLFSLEGSQVTMRDTVGGFFAVNNGIRGGYDIAPWVPGDPYGDVAVSSRSDLNVRNFRVQDNRLIRGGGAAVTAVAPGNDVRGIAVAPGGETLYLVNRLPPSLIALDMRLKDGLPRQETLWVTELCAEPGRVVLGQDPRPSASAGDLLAYVVCFGTAQIYVVEAGSGRLVDQIPTGEGPSYLAIDRTRKRALVSHYLDNTVGVIDLDPTHATFHRLVLRLGKVTQLVRN